MLRRMRPVVIVMVKAPRAGLVKTRLAPALAAADAAALAACFVRDVVTTALRVVPELLVAYAPDDGRALLEPLLPTGLHWVAQQGTDLGARLTAAVAHAAALGCDPMLVLGADSPTLPDSYIETARAALTEGAADVVLGPTTDGGYYLVGLRRPVPTLFQNIAWSTPRAYEQTAANVARLGLRLLELPAWYDVDTCADLLHLRNEVCADEQARARAPHTYRWLCAHDISPHTDA